MDSDPIQERLESAMPWVGGYIAAASAVCTIAMAADAFNVFRHRKLWFPCQYFSLNATSLTLLAVATKLPMDLGINRIYTNTDLLTKFNGVVFLSTAMANFMSSLGSNEDRDIRSNVVALAILVVTTAVDVLLQLVPLYASRYSIVYFVFFYTILMLLILATVVSLALAAPTMKRSLESMYREKHKSDFGPMGLHEMMKDWVMAETSNPQFVMARSVVCTTSALLCLLSVITLVTATVTVLTSDQKGISSGSPYGASTKWILYIQIAGVAVGSIAPIVRWFVVVSFKCSTPLSAETLKKEFKMESYWTQILVDMRDNFSIWDIHILDPKLRRCRYFAILFAINIGIGLQSFAVLLSKLFIFISTLLMTPCFFCYTSIRGSMKQQTAEDEEITNLNLGQYVLRLDGEAELPKGILRDIYRRANNMIQMGEQKRPRHLIELLNENSIDPVVDKIFTSHRIPSLHSQYNPNCWTLLVATFTNIAMALPCFTTGDKRRLLKGVREGLSLTRIVDEIQNDERVNIRRAAEIYPKNIDFMRCMKRESSKEVLEELSRQAESAVREFLQDSSPTIVENPLNWPPEVVAQRIHCSESLGQF